MSVPVITKTQALTCVECLVYRRSWWPGPVLVLVAFLVLLALGAP